jgi:hypothetical protein
MILMEEVKGKLRILTGRNRKKIIPMDDRPHQMHEKFAAAGFNRVEKAWQTPQEARPASPSDFKRMISCYSKQSGLEKIS